MKDVLKKFSLVLFITIIAATIAVAEQSEEVEMADTLRRDGKIYTVVIGLVTVLTGLIKFLIRVDRKVNHLRSKDQDKVV
ncbi:CcmD family protein [Chryseolinea sp. T2]|uniref:CcmD family protein n=1 Tax=Chryseolinea sp. T2 TaxID=3129255 RepID=UPI0030784F2B